jgi:hypothetical protein
VALSYTTFAFDDNTATSPGGDITTTSRTYNAGELVAILFSVDDNGTANNLSIANSGTAQTWTLIANTGSVAGSEHAAGWYCVMSVTQAMTITVSGDSGSSFTSCAAVIQMAGQHGTTPVPVGNIFSGTGAFDPSQSITPGASGSCLWMIASSFSSGESFTPVANCTIDQTSGASNFKAVLIRPTTQPRPNASAFTIGETETNGPIAWIAFEVREFVSTQPPSYNVSRPWLNDIINQPGIGAREVLNPLAWV